MRYIIRDRHGVTFIRDSPLHIEHALADGERLTLPTTVAEGVRFRDARPWEELAFPRPTAPTGVGSRAYTVYVPARVMFGSSEVIWMLSRLSLSRDPSFQPLVKMGLKNPP